MRTKSFIDKSPLIRDLFKQEIVLLTAPRGYGKSTILDMVKRFLEIVLDEEGNREPVYITHNYELFKKNNLNICKYPNDLFFDEHFGKYPVLYIDYSKLCGVTNFESMLSTFREILFETFLPHRDVLRNEELVWPEEGAKEQFSKYSHKFEHKKLSEENITRGFFLLSKMLCEHHSKRVFILIDEYNTHLKCLSENNGTDKSRIVDFIKYINDDLLKFNAFIVRALLTGVPLDDDSDVWPDNIVKYKFSDDHVFRQYFGVTEGEVAKTLKKNFHNEEIEKVNSHLFQSNGSSFEMTNVYSFSRFLNVLNSMTNDT